MKIIAKFSVAFDCRECGERCETESDFIWIEESRIFHCDFCGAASKIQIVPVEEKEKSNE